MKRFTTMATPFGSIGFEATDQGVCGAMMSAASPAALRDRFTNAEFDRDLCPEFQEQLHAYFTGESVRFDITVDLGRLTPFQQRVWDACRKIPYGKTATYGELAQQVGSPKAARAVGQTMARNRIPLIIPCHRVVASDGKLTGFSAEQGVELKRWLLDLESSHVRAVG